MYSTILEIENDFRIIFQTSCTHNKYADNINTDDLGDFLRKHSYTEAYSKHCSLFRKLIALYDFKKYA